MNIVEQEPHIALDSNGLDDSHHFQSDESTRNYITKAKKAAGYIHVMMHAEICHGKCGRDVCKKTSDLMDHSIECITKNCPREGCAQTKVLRNHRTICRQKRVIQIPFLEQKATPCLVCSFLNVLTINQGRKSIKRSNELAMPDLPKRYRKEENLSQPTV